MRPRSRVVHLVPPETPRFMALATRGLVADLEANISSVLLGKPEVVRLCVVAFLAGEHVLLEDVPGVGKTLLGKALARSVDGQFGRLQFTPDLLPSDIVGSSVFNAKTGEFVFNRGPIFANIVLADEINRTTPRTQSALLEAMSEGQVSVDGQTHRLPRPFMVIATQNPFEFHGTYPLPENQLDRFLFCLKVGYPDREDELAVLNSHRAGEPVDLLAPTIDGDQALSLQAAVREIAVEETVQHYLLDIVDATRNCPELEVGASTRAAICLSRAAQSLALVEGREFVVPDDVKRLAVHVLAHRVISKAYLQAGDRQTVAELVQRLVDETRPP